jgi:hypothetical protein
MIFMRADPSVPVRVFLAGLPAVQQCTRQLAAAIGQNLEENNLRK